MFDYRYHALSLAAVLLALAVGVLLGVAIGDSNLVSSAKNGVVRSLDSDLAGAQQTASQLRTQLNQQTAFENDLVPIALNGQLTGRNVGLIFLGGSSDQMDNLVRQALAPAGAQLSLVAVIHEPLNLQAIAGAATGTQYTALGTSPQLVSPFGRRVGVQLVQGGRLIMRVRDSLLSFDGQLGQLSGVVIVRDPPANLPASESQATSNFETGLVGGINALGVPTVGVELTSTNPSQVPWYRGQNISSVDDLDEVFGRVALALALAGHHGTFGIKPTADALLPEVIGGVPTP